MTLSDSTTARGLFVTFEGGEATGKTTQARILADRLGAIFTREPGDTPLGATLRAMCLGDEFDPTPITELLLMGADRAEHVARVILPALEKGQSVVCDRYTHSTVAYQGAGRGMDPETITAINEIASGGLVPDVIFLIHVDEAVAAERHGRRGGKDRMESAGALFHARIRQSYLDQAAADDRIIVIDGNGDQDAVAKLIWAEMASRTS
jgi:dTMP kinase